MAHSGPPIGGFAAEGLETRPEASVLYLGKRCFRAPGISGTGKSEPHMYSGVMVMAIKNIITSTWAVAATSSPLRPQAALGQLSLVQVSRLEGLRGTSAGTTGGASQARAEGAQRSVGALPQRLL